MQFESKNEGGDLVVKAYFVRKKLTWEVLQNGYWKNIEIEWSNIVGIKTSLKENEPAILEIEVYMTSSINFMSVELYSLCCSC